MANTDDRNRDNEFRQRLKNHDQTVLVDIEQTYGPYLKRVLGRYRGPAISDHDIDGFLSEAMEAVWRCFDPSNGCSVRGFYFLCGRNRCVSELRKRMRELAKMREKAESHPKCNR